MYRFAADVLTFIRDHWGYMLGVFLGVFVLSFVVYASIVSHNEWVAWCEGEGGRVISDTDTNVGTGIDSSGNVTTVTTTSTDYYCINETGGILDIR